MVINGVVETVAHLLREEIICGQLSSGTRLNETELSNRIGISRPPLREAFRKLEHENLLTSIPRKGTYVTAMSIRDCEQIYSARRFIECSIVDILCEKRVTELPSVEKAFVMAAEFLAPDLSVPSGMFEYFQVMSGFHNELVKSCQNEWIIRSYSDLSLHLARYQIVYLNMPGTYQLSLGEHSQFLSLIKAGSYAEAKELLSLHIKEAFGRVEERMSQTNMPREEKVSLSS